MKLGAEAAMNARAMARAGAGVDARKRLENVWHVKCFDKDGNLKWEDEIHNLVVNVGLDDSLDKHLKGSAYTAAWYVGLTASTPNVQATDTMGSHGGWTEVQAYDEGTREVAVFGSVSSQSVDNSGTPAEFTIDTNNTTVGGAFLTSDGTKGGGSGILYGGGAFSGGDKTLDDNDVLQVTITCTAAAS